MFVYQKKSIISFINKYFYYSLFAVTSDATRASPTIAAVEEEAAVGSPEGILPDLGTSPSSGEHSQLLEEAEAEGPAPKRKKGRKKNGDAPGKYLWSFSAEKEMELVEWLKANSFLWLRSSKDYHRKREAWAAKALELGVELKHLTNWWKNIKDWYVKLSKKTSGQAAKQLTTRDKWVLTHIAFYKSKYMS